MRYFLPIVLLLAGCSPATTSAIPTAAVSRPTSTPAATPVPTRLPVGQEAHLWVEDGAPWYLAENESRQMEYTKALTANDTIGIQDLIRREHLFAVDSGTRVLVLEHYRDMTKVRVMEGPQYGKAGWVAFEHVH